jgi:hypothetical protein
VLLSGSAPKLHDRGVLLARAAFVFHLALRCQSDHAGYNYDNLAVSFLFLLAFD